MTGTIKEFIGKSITINNKTRDQLFWNFILNFGWELGVCKKVGEQKPPGGKGKPAVIWEIPEKFEFKA